MHYSVFKLMYKVKLTPPSIEKTHYLVKVSSLTAAFPFSYLENTKSRTVIFPEPFMADSSIKSTFKSLSQKEFPLTSLLYTNFQIYVKNLHEK